MSVARSAARTSRPQVAIASSTAASSEAVISASDSFKRPSAFTSRLLFCAMRTKREHRVNGKPTVEGRARTDIRNYRGTDIRNYRGEADGGHVQLLPRQLCSDHVAKASQPFAHIPM